VIVVPTKERADRLVGLLADWRYYGEDGWEDIFGDVG
jgi:hypothetical protein